jgi:hypothetical protein
MALFDLHSTRTSLIIKQIRLSLSRTRLIGELVLCCASLHRRGNRRPWTVAQVKPSTGRVRSVSGRGDPARGRASQSWALGRHDPAGGLHSPTGLAPNDTGDCRRVGDYTGRASTSLLSVPPGADKPAVEEGHPARNKLSPQRETGHIRRNPGSPGVGEVFRRNQGSLGAERGLPARERVFSAKSRVFQRGRGCFGGKQGLAARERVFRGGGGSSGAEEGESARERVFRDGGNLVRERNPRRCAARRSRGAAPTCH